MSLPLPGSEAVEEGKLSQLDAGPTDDGPPDASARAPTAKILNGAAREHVPFSGAIRAPSPDALSNLSVDDINGPRGGETGAWLPLPRRRRPSRSPAPPRSWRGRIDAFWVRNKGLALVLISQLFGTLMNVTTRLLEIEGNNGKGMHPFQVREGARFLDLGCRANDGLSPR